MNNNNLLKERAETYGEYMGQATISQELKTIMRKTDNWDKLMPDQKESLEMIQHKIARILNGNCNYDDSWIDIAGYSTLIYNRLIKVNV